MRTLPAARAVTLAASLLLVTAAAPAFAADSTYTVPLHQQKDLPVTASSAPVDKEGDCPVPAGTDGWHFVLPGKSSHFVKLTVTFQPGGQQVITSFGPPSDKHAYVSSQPGAQLTSAVAEVDGGELKWFNLSHTCPAAGATDGPTDSPSASTTPGGTEGTGTSGGTGGTGGDSASGGTGASPSPSTGSGSGSSGGTDGSSGASPTTSSTPGGGDLAETGSSATTGWIAGAAVVLLAGGGFMVLRRRKAGQH